MKSSTADLDMRDRFGLPPRSLPPILSDADLSRRTPLTPWEEFIASTATVETSVYESTKKRIAATLNAREAELRRMLSLWVSELEPVAVYRRDGYTDRLVGLSCAGIPPGAIAPICVHALPGTP